MRVSATLPKLISYSLAVFSILSWTEGAEKAEMVDVVMGAEKLVAESAEKEVARVMGETSGWRYEIFAMTSPGIELNHAASPSHPVALAIRKNAGSLGRAKTVEDKNKIEDFRSSSIGVIWSRWRR